MIERERLKKAIDNIGSIRHSNSQKQLMWSGTDGTGWIDIGALHIQGVGLVTLPLKQSDIVKIAKKFSLKEKSTQRTNFEKTCCSVNASVITVIPDSPGTTQQKILENVTYNTLQRMLGVSFGNLSFIAESKLEKLVICANGETYKGNFSPLNGPDGKFGTLMLKIPLKFNKPPGKVIANDGTRETQVDLGVNSHHAILAVAGCCLNEVTASYSVHAGPDEAIAMLIFHLVWSDHIMFGHNDILSPVCLPEFLQITSEIEAALASWRETKSTIPQTSQNNQGLVQPAFFCLPFSGLNEELDLFKPNLKDKIIVKSLMSISYLDVHFARIAPEVPTKVGTVPKATALPSLLQFDKAIDSPHRIADDIFASPISVSQNMFHDLSAYGIRAGLTRPSISVIVIRPRGFDHVTISHDKETQKLKIELFMESIVRRVNDHAEKNVLDNFLVKSALEKELDEALTFLKRPADDTSRAKLAQCPKCFFSRLFDTFCRMNSVLLAFKFLDKVQCHIFENISICRCSVHPYDRNLADSFAKFIFLSTGWVHYPQAMEQLSNQMLAEGSCSLLVEIAFTLMRNNFGGAKDTFQVILRAVKKSLSKPEEFKKMFHHSLPALALHLHKQKKTDQQALDLLLSGFKFLEPTQLTDLIGYLVKLTKEESLDCKFFVEGISDIVLSNSFENFTPQEFLTITGVYRAANEQEIVKRFWKKLCSRCADLLISNENSSCLFCGVLKECNTVETLVNILCELTHVKEVKDAVKSSLCKISRHPEQFTIANCTDYIDCILLLEEHGLLAEINVVELLSSFFSRLSPGIMVKLASSLFVRPRELGKVSLKTQIIGSLLREIDMLDSDVILQDMDVENILFCSAWIGALDVVKSIVRKLNAAVTAKKKDHSSKVALICQVLTKKNNDDVPASSLKFTRDVFYYLMLECFKSLGHLIDIRSSYCVECFCMLATSERSFIDPAPAPVCKQWKSLSKSFTFLETASVVKRIGEKEIASQEASLKKFPSSWNAFKELCSSLLSKWPTSGNLVGIETFSSHCFVTLTQCFFWIDEENLIADFSRHLNEAQRSFEVLADVHSAIIRDKKTIDLASSSVHATLAFNDLIDTRIKILHGWLTDSAKRDSNQPVQSSQNAETSSALASMLQTLDRLKALNTTIQQPGTMEPARKQRKLDPAVLPSNSLEENWQKEIDELQALRKQIFTKSLLKQSQASSKS